MNVQMESLAVKKLYFCKNQHVFMMCFNANKSTSLDGEKPCPRRVSAARTCCSPLQGEGDDTLKLLNPLKPHFLYPDQQDG